MICDLFPGTGHMYPESEELGSLGRNDRAVLGSLDGAAPIAPHVGAHRDGSRIYQTKTICGTDKQTAQNAANLLCHQGHGSSSAVEAAVLKKIGEKIQVMLAHKAQPQLFVSAKEGITDHCHGDDLAVREPRLRPSLTKNPFVRKKLFVDVVDQDKPHNENVFPWALSDIIRQTVHAESPVIYSPIVERLP